MNHYNKDLMIRASQQALYECLGFDEGKVYYLILTKKQKNIEKEFSYSKKYRLLKRLFDSGALARLKTDKRDFFTYVPLPPCFLYNRTPQRIIDFLEEIYVKNYIKILETKFSQIILKDVDYFILFLLKHVMKESARILGVEINNSFESYLGENTEKIVIKTSAVKNQKIGLIDKKLGFEFSRIIEKDSFNYIGYISHLDKCNNSFHIESIKKELDEFN